jgi:small GTP-binding protein
MQLPASLKDTRRFFESIDIHQIEAGVADEIRAQVAIIGPVNSGKSTLFNQLKGQKLSKVSAVPGTTTQALVEQFGPFQLIDTPGFGELGGETHSSRALEAASKAAVAILVLDAMAGIRQSDADLLAQVGAMGIPVVVALNKIDLVRRDLPAILRDLQNKLRVPVIPISARNGSGLADQLIPAVIAAHPRMAVTVGRALPRYRRIAAGQIIRESSAIAGVLGGEPVPFLSFPLLVGVQIRMLLRLAAIYGEVMGVARARELLGAIVGGWAIRYGAQELAKIVPAIGWIAAGFAAWSGTSALGGAAVLFFESKGKLTPQELREVYKRIRSGKQKNPEAQIVEDEPHN